MSRMLAPMRSLGPRETRELLDRFGLHPKTGIGQHFVTDPNTVRRVVEIAGVQPGMRVLEVGPGLGALTMALLDAGAEVVAVERDRALEPILTEVAPRARVIWDDAMAVHYEQVLGTEPAIMVANLPYQIATPLVVDLLVGMPSIGSHTVMVQKEVGERLAAAPGTDAYGGVSVKVAALADARIAMRVSRRVFYPMPDVESVVVRIDRLAQPRVPVPVPHLFSVIDAGFGQRRKTIRNALRSRWEDAAVTEALARAGVAPGARAEVLSVEQFGAIAAELPS